MLAGTYEIPAGGYGGFSYNLDASQDWSSFRGIRFWWYASQSNNPASPTAGDDITVEIKDGGPDGEHSELWKATFKDNWGSSTSRWKLVELPFSSFTLGGYQPGDAATQNGTLDLTSAWGFAPTMPPGKTGSIGWAIDDVQLYGTAPAGASVTVSSAADVYLVDAGETATSSSYSRRRRETRSPPTRRWSTPTDRARRKPARHFAPFSGSVTFPAGSAPGTTRSFDVQTLAARAETTSRSVR